jgi:hypothetical protein
MSYQTGARKRVMVPGEGVLARATRCRPSSARQTRRASHRSIRFARLELEDKARFPPACASPPSVATCPRVAVRSSMSGASWLVAQVDGCGAQTLIRPARAVRLRRLGMPSHIGRWVIDARARPWSRRSRRALRYATLAAPRRLPAGRECRRDSLGRVPASGSRFPPLDPVREAGERGDLARSLPRRAHRHLPSRRARAFVDERRVVADDAANRQIALAASTRVRPLPVRDMTPTRATDRK